jgi:hypothetical protein
MVHVSAPCCEPLLTRQMPHPTSAKQKKLTSSFLTLPVYAALFALGILSKALLLGMLPLAGYAIAPDNPLMTLPVITLLLGWIGASAFQNILRSSSLRLELSSSLGVVGGLMLAYSLWAMSLAGLSVATLLVGYAQGASFAIRHKAADQQKGGSAFHLSIVFGAALCVGLIGPFLSQTMEALLQPVAFVGTALLATTAHALSLILSVGLSEEPSPLPAKTGCCSQHNKHTSDRQSSSLLWPHLATALAWFFMIMAMTAGPLALASCGINVSGVSQSVAWHLCAMFAPALCLAYLNRFISAEWIIKSSLIVGVLSIAMLLSAKTPSFITLAMIMSGAAWSLTTSASSLLLGQKGQAEIRFIQHDRIVYSAALLGALVSGILFQASL